MIEKLLLISLLLVIFISGCINQPEISEKDKVISACVEECKARVARGEDLSNGPCLLNPIPDSSDWVCDVAHSPRQAVDNKPENQCSVFREGKAKHFVEVTPECELIRTW